MVYDAAIIKQVFNATRSRALRPPGKRFALGESIFYGAKANSTVYIAQTVDEAREPRIIKLFPAKVSLAWIKKMAAIHMEYGNKVPLFPKCYGLRIFEELGQIRCYLELEQIPGINLLELIGKKNGEIPLRATLDIMLQLCQLSEFHKLSHFHNDLKEANIMVDGPIEGIRVKVVDLGSARHIGIQKDFICGTEGYVAPECVKAMREDAKNEERFVDQRADIYSLGIIFHHLVTDQDVHWMEWGHGYTPLTFSREKIQRALSFPYPGQSHENINISRLKDLLDMIFEKMVTHRMSWRYDSLDEVKKDLLAAVDMIA